MSSFTNQLRPGDRMPALFVGHGSPMNAILDTDFAQGDRAEAQVPRKHDALEKIDRRIAQLHGLARPLAFRHEDLQKRDAAPPRPFP